MGTGSGIGIGIGIGVVIGYKTVSNCEVKRSLVF